VWSISMAISGCSRKELKDFLDGGVGPALD
jgi:hypothetical protein